MTKRKPKKVEPYEENKFQTTTNQDKKFADRQGPNIEDKTTPKSSMNQVHSWDNDHSQNSKVTPAMKQSVIQPVIEFEISEHEYIKETNAVVS
jgi:hypothetical protein